MKNRTGGTTVGLEQIEKSPQNIRIAFGECLELCGLKRASDYLDKLLNQEPYEAFNEIIPNQDAFQRFQERFPFAVVRAMTARQWTYDKAKLDNSPPQAKDTIRDYYNSTFVSVVRA
jgi:hypothetical protein